MSSAVCEQPIVAVLEVQFSGRHCNCELRQGERLYIGSDEGSDVSVPDPEVAPTHCAIMAVSDAVAVEDCYSPEGTFVDGQRIRAIQLNRNAEVRLGNTTISVRLRQTRSEESSEASSATVEPAATPAARPDTDAESCGASDPAAASGERSAAPSLGGTAEQPAAAGAQSANPAEPDPWAEVENLKLELLQSHEENRILQRRLKSIATPDAAPAGDAEQEEMLELLRAEVLDLQAALAAAQAESQGGTPSAAEVRDEDVLPRDEAEKLVARLEELLAELEQRDTQIATLNELLQLAEEANRTDREEREQLDSWLKDIEVRFGQREQEWHAERAELQRSLDAIAAERDRAEAALNADSISGKLEAAQNVLQGLRETADAQRQRLLDSEQTVAQLRRQLEEARASGGMSPEEKSRVAEERAELARLRQELRSSQNSAPREELKQTDLKLRALRQHLSEIHAEERAEREERKLSSRLSRIWRRLEGH